MSTHSINESGVLPRAERLVWRPFASLPENLVVKWKVVGAIVVTAVLWSSAFVAVRAALKGYRPVELAAVRYLVASVILAIRAMFKGAQLPRKGDWPRLIACACLGFALYATLLNYGETHVAAGPASFLVYTVPLFTAISAAILLRERMGTLGWAGLCVSLAGTALLSFGTNTHLHFEPGVVTLLTAALSLGLYFILQKPLVLRYGALTTTAWAIWLATIFLLPFFPWKNLLAVPPTAMYSVLYLGVLPTAVAYSTWAYVVARIPVARATTCLYSIPAITTVIGFVVLGERPTLLGVNGGTIAISCVALANIRRSSATRRSQKQRR